MVHEGYSIDEVGDVIMTNATPSPKADELFPLYPKGEQGKMPQMERCDITELDGSASGVLKRIPRALALENDEWVDFVDVRGCSEAWYEESGNVVVWYGS
jgi:hypothetical protein